jgi:ABC-type nitrate/sulfonate/bicarbonate transport system substrate-binding protein
MADTLEVTTLDATTAEKSGDSDVLRLGFVPLTDCAPLLVADEHGLFRRHGVNVRLSPVNAWAALRDRVAIGKHDGGQMLSPMPIASSLGLGGMATELAVVSVLARQGNTITLSDKIMAEVAAAAPELAALRPLPAAALAAALARRRHLGKPTPILATVFAYSSHHYLLRHWLASAGVVPEYDVQLRVVPPPLVADELAEDHIDGFCAGAPWGARAVDLDAGRIVLDTADIWPDHPEKVLAISAERLARTPEQIAGLVAALIEAGIWLSDPAHHAEAARLLQSRALPDVPEAVIAQSLAGRGASQFHPAATYPHPEHGQWWLGQMQRWEHAPASAGAGLIEHIWRPDIWRRGATLAGIDTATPALPPTPPAALG